MEYDVVIIGAGAAGLSAAIYTCRKRLKTAVISIDTGGQTNLTTRIENYPGTEPMQGHELMKKFKDNAESFGCSFINGKAVEVEKTKEGFRTTMAHGQTVISRAVIAAFGKVPRCLGIPGEEKYCGRGIHQSTFREFSTLKGKTVAVIGGGNSAIETVLETAPYAAKIILIHRRDTFRADETTISKLKKLNNTEIFLNSTPIEVKGGEKISGIRIKKGNEEKELKADAVISEIGFMNDPGPVRKLVELNEKNEIIINERCETKTPGLYAAGDCTTIPFKQTITSAGEGAKAGLEAHRYLTGGKGTTIDWTH